jgi:ABC-2 type transport system permease protein
MPAVILPQVLLCGLFVPHERMAELLEWVSWALPMTYAYDALIRVTSHSDPGGRLLIDVAVMAGATLIALALGAATLPRRTP